MTAAQPVRKPADPTAAAPQQQDSVTPEHGTKPTVDLRRVTHAGASLPPQVMRRLQQSYGNRAVNRLVQPKLKVGPADDPHEREADHVAETVMRAPTVATPPPITPASSAVAAPVVQREPDAFLQKQFQRMNRALLTREVGKYGEGKIEAFYNYKKSEIKTLLDLRRSSLGLGKLFEPRHVTDRISGVKGLLLLVAYGKGLDVATDYKKRLLAAGLTKNKTKDDDEGLDPIIEALKRDARRITLTFHEIARIEAEEAYKMKAASTKRYFEHKFLGEESGFWEQLREIMGNDDLEQEYRALQGVAPDLGGFHDASSGTYMTSFKATAPKAESTEAGGSLPDASDPETETAPPDEYFVKTLRDKTAFDKAIEAKKKNIVMPLLARTLGVDTLPLAAGKFRGDDPMIYTKLVKGKDFSKLDYDDKDDAGDIKKIKDINLVKLQKTVLFDLLFENQDAHYKQYMITDAGDLLKIDQEAYLWGQHELASRKLRAGSFLAGLPQANAPLEGATVRMVESWNSANLAELMRRAGIFSEEELERVLGNMGDIKSLVAGDATMSIRTLFAKYNGYDTADDIEEFEGKETNIATKLTMKGTKLGMALQALTEVMPILSKLDDMESRYKAMHTSHD